VLLSPPVYLVLATDQVALAQVPATDQVALAQAPATTLDLLDLLALLTLRVLRLPALAREVSTFLASVEVPVSPVSVVQEAREVSEALEDSWVVLLADSVEESFPVFPAAALANFLVSPVVLIFLASVVQEAAQKVALVA
jgi:hypothetical protein